MLKTGTRILPIAAFALLPLTTASFASSPDAWREHYAQVTEKCIQASGLKDAKRIGQVIDYSDDVGFSAAIITGIYPQPHMDNQEGHMLCLFDRRSGSASSEPIVDVEQ